MVGLEFNKLYTKVSAESAPSSKRKTRKKFFLQDADRLSCQIIKIYLPVLITAFEKAKEVSREVV